MYCVSLCCGPVCLDVCLAACVAEAACLVIHKKYKPQAPARRGLVKYLLFGKPQPEASCVSFAGATRWLCCPRTSSCGGAVGVPPAAVPTQGKTGQSEGRVLVSLNLVLVFTGAGAWGLAMGLEDTSSVETQQPTTGCCLNCMMPLVDYKHVHTKTI